MRATRRRAVSPIIATLLLIAIAVAGGIIVYVFVNSISGGLTQQGGQQVADQVSMDAYTFSTVTAPQLVLRNIGSTSVTIQSIYFDGNLCQPTGSTCTSGGVGNNPNINGGTCSASSGPIPVTCTAGQYVQLTLTVSSQTAGTSHIIRVETSDGGTFTFTIIAGRSG
ncbi:MAG TPA: archaellin/type IV pilin N-terminal domain-containing protein [Nitrososphaerales archaeon]|nr:archaellin/type IV pilin N-terminal domain-containing protein [Nitrososphaerales archaeon]